MKTSMRLGSLLAVSALVLASCTAEESPGPSGSGGGTGEDGEALSVYFATFAIGNAFWGLMERGANDAAAQNGVDVTWTQGTEFSVEETVTRMEAAIAAQPDVMVVTDIDPGAFEPLMQEAQDAGIIVININAESPEENPPELVLRRGR